MDKCNDCYFDDFQKRINKHSDRIHKVKWARWKYNGLTKNVDSHFSELVKIQCFLGVRFNLCLPILPPLQCNTMYYQFSFLLSWKAQTLVT